jgi:hypothetical protein
LRIRQRIAVFIAAVALLGVSGTMALANAPAAEAKSCKWYSYVPDPSTPWVVVHICSFNRP